MDSLQIKSLSLQLPDGVVLCSDLSFTVDAGNVLVLMGPSGSGKSTLLSWLTGTLDHRIKATGEVWLGEQNLSELETEHRRLGLVLQQDYLFPHMTVSDNLKFGLRGGTRSERSRRVQEHLDLAGLHGLSDRNPATLSGGQRARVSLLRTLLSDPSALLLDEPFSRLDVSLREQIREFTWRSAKDLPVLLVTHDATDIPAGANVLRLNDEGQNPPSDDRSTFQVSG